MTDPATIPARLRELIAERRRFYESGESLSVRDVRADMLELLDELEAADCNHAERAFQCTACKGTVNQLPIPCPSCGASSWREVLREAAADALRELPQPEICICAAIRLRNGEVWRGHRHDSAILTASRAPNVDLDGHEQGFVTSRNRFVSREEGARLQRAAGIPSAHTMKAVNDMLFSEDLYLRDWRSPAALRVPPAPPDGDQ